MAHPSNTQPSPPFHGWRILTMATVCQFVATGFTVFIFGLFIDPLAEALNTGRAQIGSGSAIFYIVMALSGPVLGIWVDRGKVKWILTAGAILQAAGLALLSQVTTPIQAGLACLFFIAPGAAMLGMIPATAMVIQWFERRRALAVGICVAGMSLGGFLSPPFVAWLISLLDWRSSLLILATLIAVVVVPLTWFIAVAKPSDIGQHPDGKPLENNPEKTSSIPQVSLSFAQLVLTREFWTIAFTMGLISYSGVCMSTYIIPFASEQGLDLQYSAMMMSLVTGAAFIAKFVSGWLSDHFNITHVVSAIAIGVSIAWLPMLMLDGIWPMVISAILAGFSTGSLTPAIASLISFHFGPNAYGRVQGAIGPVSLIFLVLPGPVGGYLFDLNGSYKDVFATLWWLLPVAFAVSLTVPRKSRLAPTV